MSTSLMAVKPIREKSNAVSDNILKPVFNAGKSIEIENITVSFKTPKGSLHCCKRYFIKCKERRDCFIDWSLRLWQVHTDGYYQRYGKTYVLEL